MLSTPYYSTIVAISENQCGNQSSSNYRPYDLFCLLTQLQTYLTLKGEIQGLSCVSLEEEGRMALKIKTTLAEKEQAKAQKKVNKIISNRPLFCLLYAAGLDKENYLPWLRGVLPYVDLPEIYNPFVLDDSLYVNLSLSDNYLVEYDKLVSSVKKQLARFWRRGYIAKASLLSEKWSLQPLFQDGQIYAPNWRDSRFAKNLTRFLLSRLEGQTEIRLTFLSNPGLGSFLVSLPMRQAIAKILQGKDFSFLENSVVFSVDNLNQAQSLTDQIEEAAYSAVGQVETKSFSLESQARAEESQYEVLYFVADSKEPYVLSRGVTF